MRRRRWVAVVAVAAVAATGAAIGIRLLLGHVAAVVPSCRVGASASALALDPEQAANAATIAGVARRMRLPDHAVTVAIATVLQESKLHNLPFGDRDSVGLFQQRPSQGWGTPAQLLTPAFATEAFFRHLRKVPRWQSLPVAQAAQSVQHSADGSAYAVWEEEAGALARALTGEVTGIFGCRFPTPKHPLGDRLSRLAARELGRGALRRDGSPRQDWTVAQWLVAHAYQYGIVAVSVGGRRWTHDSFRWSHDDGTTGAVTYELAPAPGPSGTTAS